MKVNKQKFDSILGKLLKASPVKRDEVKTDAKKPAKIIPATK
jgi:hypothetical protein